MAQMRIKKGASNWVAIEKDGALIDALKPPFYCTIGGINTIKIVCRDTENKYFLIDNDLFIGDEATPTTKNVDELINQMNSEILNFE